MTMARTSPHTVPTARLASLDAYRGFVMLLMASELLQIPQVAGSFRKNPAWGLLARQFSHAEWAGCTLWDLIQPSFMFLVGVALAYSYAARRARGQSEREMLRHAVYRALLLTLLGLLEQLYTGFSFEHVLTQIGLGYTFLFLLCTTSAKVQAVVAFGLLAGYWGAFALYPLPPHGFDYRTVGLPADWAHLPGFAAHWDKNTNLAAGFDRWFLNLFPCVRVSAYNAEGYQTLNFIPSLATMIFGLLAGALLRSERSPAEKLRVLAGAGVGGLVLGAALSASGVCPIVKRIWTPSWAIYSAGWSCLLLAGFFAILDAKGYVGWAFPLRVVGMNSLVIYFLVHLSEGLVLLALAPRLPPRLVAALGGIYAPLVVGLSVLVVLWLACYGLYRRGIFVRL
jgi:predicted acyltransferase